MDLRWRHWCFIGSIDINLAGRVIVGLFFAVWVGAVLNWKLRNLDERYGIARGGAEVPDAAPVP